MTLLIAKSLHIIGFTCWFAGLFYIVRLYIYDVEARATGGKVGEALCAQFQVMQRRLWYGITWPAMCFTWVFGLWLVSQQSSIATWLIIKLGLLVLLVGYHLLLGSIRKALLTDKGTPWSSRSLRILNEVATLFLVAIVFTAVLKSALTWTVALSVMGSLVLLLAGGFGAYQIIRNRR